MIAIHSQQALEALIHQTPLLLAYFTGDTCAACTAIQSQLENLLADFPHITAVQNDAPQQKALCAAHSVFTVPTTLIFTQGKEALRLGRHLDLTDLRRQLNRYSELLAD